MRPDCAEAGCPPRCSLPGWFPDQKRNNNNKLVGGDRLWGIFREIDTACSGPKPGY